MHQKTKPKNSVWREDNFAKTFEKNICEKHLKTTFVKHIYKNDMIFKNVSLI